MEIVRYAETAKDKTGKYPADLDAYVFKKPWVRSHIAGVSVNDAGEFYISYFMNNAGTSYWYSSKTGFGYYPD